MPLEPKALETLRIDRGGGTERYEEETRKRWPYFVAAIVFALMVVAFFVFRPKAPVVTTMRVEASSTPSSGAAVLNASGYVVARRVATISAQVTRRLTEVMI